MRDLASINQEAAQLRAQADGLHKAALGEMRKLYADVGQKQDAAAREAAKAHKAAEEATGQATRELKNAEQYRGDADAADVEAARLAGAGDASGAEEMREQAAGLRAWAAGAIDQAERASQEAARETARAVELDAEVERVNDTSGMHLPQKSQEALADQLDNKARLLEEAAKSERQAIVAEMDGDGGAEYTARALAEYELSRADAIHPDYESVDPKYLHGAGIELSQQPGAELIDPTTQASNDTLGESRFADDVAESFNNNEPHPGGEQGDKTMGETTDAIDLKEIDAEIDALRNQAKALHEESQRRFVRTGESTQRDEDAAEAWGLRQKAKATERQVERELSSAERAEKRATENEAEADKLERSGKPAEAEELRENAQAERELAASNRERAQDAQQRGEAANEKAAELEENVKDFESGKGMDSSITDIELAADAIDDKVRALESAKGSFDDARLMDNDPDMVQSAHTRLAEARAINPDLSKVPEDVRAAAGVEQQPREPQPLTGEGEPEPQPAPAEPMKLDTDGDGLDDELEQYIGTKIDNQDSDGDGLTDGFEFRNTTYGLDPKVADADGDTVLDGDELTWRTNPKDADSDDDGFDDGKDLFPTDPKLYPGAPSENFKEHLDNLQNGVPQAGVGDEGFNSNVASDTSTAAMSYRADDSSVGDTRYESGYSDPAAEASIEEPSYESASADIGGYGSDVGADAGYASTDSGSGYTDEALSYDQGTDTYDSDDSSSYEASRTSDSEASAEEPSYEYEA